MIPSPRFAGRTGGPRRGLECVAVTVAVYLERRDEWIELRQRLGGGAEGEVHSTTDPRLLVKVFTKCQAEKLPKVEQMMNHPLPSDRFATPTDVVRDAPGGAFQGFAMPAFRGVPLFAVCHPTAKSARTLSADRMAKLEIACQLADLYAVAHAHKVVIADGNPNNFLVKANAQGGVERPARVVGIDCDGYQWPGRDPATGRVMVFPCGLGMAPYLAPELIGVDLRTVFRTESQDSFQLATKVWQLVKGDFPFAVSDPTGRHLPDMNSLIRRGQFPHAPAAPLPPGLRPTDRGVPWSRLPTDVRDLMARCFRDGHANPAARPSAAQWRTALDAWLQAERGKLPTPGKALWSYIRGHANRGELRRAFGWAAERANLGQAWAWATAGNHPKWLLGGAALAGLLAWGYVWPADGTNARAREAAILDARQRWEGSPPIWREALEERLRNEGLHREGK